MSRLEKVIHKITTAQCTMGTGIVTDHICPGEVRLAGRHERVLVAGNAMPVIGELAPWVRVDGQTLVTSYHLRGRLPSPSSSHEVRIPINISTGLLYGDDLPVGRFCYGASWAPEEGGVEVSAISLSNWIQTLALAPSPASAYHCNTQPGGDFLPGHEYRFRHTFYKANGTSGDGETTPSGLDASFIPGGYREGPYSVLYRVSNAYPNGGYRIYCSTEGGPFVRCGEQASPKWGLLLISNPVSTGEPMPQVNTLSLRRVALHLSWAGELESDLARIVIYRSLVQELPSDPSPPLGWIGEAKLPLSLIYGLWHWIDDTGAEIGDPPPFEIAE